MKKNLMISNNRLANLEQLKEEVKRNSRIIKKLRAENRVKYEIGTSNLSIIVIEISSVSIYFCVKKCSIN